MKRSYPPVARVIPERAGLGGFKLQIRSRRGRWTNDTSIDEGAAYHRRLVRRYEDLAAWAVDQALRQVDRQTIARVKALGVLEQKLNRIDAAMKFLHPHPRRKR